MKSSRLPSPGRRLAVPLLAPPPWQLTHLASVLTGSAPGTAPALVEWSLPACLNFLDKPQMLRLGSQRSEVKGI